MTFMFATSRRRGRHTRFVSSDLPLGTLVQDAVTPEQLPLYIPITDTLGEDYTATVRYRLSGVSTWKNAPNLWRIEPQYSDVTVAEAFAGTIFDLLPNTAYEVEVTVSNGTTSEVLTDTFTTRAFHRAASGTPTTVTTKAALQSAINSATAGTVIEIPANTTIADAGDISINNKAGTAADPIFIRGADAATSILTRAGGAADRIFHFINATSHIVIEDLTLKGYGTDVPATSGAAVIEFHSDATADNITLRRLTIAECNRGIMQTTGVGTGHLIYDCTLTGNNIWDQATIESNATWNDDGIRLGGTGNCVFNCTFDKFGDTVGFITGNALKINKGNFIYRNKITNAGDDGIEAEYSHRNNGIYDNHVTNCMTALSFDGIFGGPLYYFRNRTINVGRTILKCGDKATGVLIWNNTFAKMAGVAGNAGGTRMWYWSQVAIARDWEFKNNLLLWEGAGDILRWDGNMADGVAHTPVAMTHNGWGRNAQNINYAGPGGASGNVATVNAALAPQHNNDIEITNQAAVFTTPVVFPAFYYNGVSTEYSLALKTAAEGIGAGTVIAGINTSSDIGAYGFSEAPPVIGVRPVMPAWRTAMTDSTWAVVPGNTLASIDPNDDAGINPNHPADAPWHANGGQHMIMTAWCGACFDPDGKLHIPLSGGHTDYAGNEPYSNDLMQATPNWALLRNPSGAIGNEGVLNDGQEATGMYFDGRPRAIHSYNKHVWVPGVGPVLAALGNTSWSGQAGTVDTMSMNPVTGEWTKRTLKPGGTGSSSGGGTCYDSFRHRVWWLGVGTGDLAYLDPDTWTWTVQTSRAANPQGGYNTLVYVPTLDVIVQFNSTSNRIWECANLTDSYVPTFSGTTPAIAFSGCAASWDSDTGRILLWNNATDTTAIYALIPPASGPATNAWVWQTLTLDAGNAVTPTAKQTNGTFGRFGYSTALRGCYLINRVTESVHFFATPEQSALEKLANNMGANEFKLLKEDTTSVFPTNGWQSWTSKCVYNPINKTISLVAAAVGTTDYYIWSYDMATDSFSFTNISWTAPGHGYDGNALDPNSGRRFFNHYSFGQRYLDFGTDPNSANWVNISDTATGVNKVPFASVITGTMHWVDFLNGGAGGVITLGPTGELAWWHNPTDGWTEVTTGVSSWGWTRDFHSTYQPTLAKAFVGQGTNLWKFGSDLSFVACASPQTATGTFRPALTDGIFFPDPGSNKLVGVNYAATPYDLATYDDATNTWSPLAAPSGDVTHLTSGNLQHTTALIPELGVVAFMTNVNSGATPRISLYKVSV